MRVRRYTRKRWKHITIKKVISRHFEPNDQVLLYNSRLTLFLRKLRSCWSGPFTVLNINPYGAITLINNKGDGREPTCPDFHTLRSSIRWCWDGWPDRLHGCSASHEHSVAQGRRWLVLWGRERPALGEAATSYSRISTMAFLALSSDLTHASSAPQLPCLYATRSSDLEDLSRISPRPHSHHSHLCQTCLHSLRKISSPS